MWSPNDKFESKKSWKIWIHSEKFTRKNCERCACFFFERICDKSISFVRRKISEKKFVEFFLTNLIYKKVTLTTLLKLWPAAMVFLRGFFPKPINSRFSRTKSRKLMKLRLQQPRQTRKVIFSKILYFFSFDIFPRKFFGGFLFPSFLFSHGSWHTKSRRIFVATNGPINSKIIFGTTPRSREKIPGKKTSKKMSQKKASIAQTIKLTFFSKGNFKSFCVWWTWY